MDDLVDQYTPEMAKLGKPTELEFGDKTSFYNNATNTLRIDGKGKTGLDREWQRLDGCVKHEFGHWFHYRALARAPEIKQESLDAATDDWQRLKTIFRRNGEADSLRNDYCANSFARKIFGKDYNALSLDDLQSPKSPTQSEALPMTGIMGMGIPHIRGSMAAICAPNMGQRTTTKFRT